MDKQNQLDGMTITREIEKKQEKDKTKTVFLFTPGVYVERTKKQQ